MAASASGGACGDAGASVPTLGVVVCGAHAPWACLQAESPPASACRWRRPQVLKFAIDAVKAEAFNPKTLFLFGSYTIGASLDVKCWQGMLAGGA